MSAARHRAEGLGATPSRGRRRPRSFRLKAGLQTALLFAIAAAGAAAERENAINDAKRALDAIKAARDPAAQPKADLPQIDAPELQIAKPGPSPWKAKRERITKAELEAAKREKNWLIDAMERGRKIDEARREGRDAVAELESERVLSAREDLRSDEWVEADPNAAAVPAETPGAENDERRRERKPDERDVVNPLASYMAGWMTPQDFALLQPNQAGPASPGGRGETVLADGGFVPGTASGGDGAAPAALGSEALGGIFGGGKSTGISGAPVENPYLQALGPIAPSELVFTPPPAPSPPPATSNSAPIFAPSPAAESVAPAKSKVPDFVRPTEDEKYFKQLKRF